MKGQSSSTLDVGTINDTIEAILDNVLNKLEYAVAFVTHSEKCVKER